jgi:hypothetical protein
VGCFGWAGVIHAIPDIAFYERPAEYYLWKGTFLSAAGLVEPKAAGALCAIWFGQKALVESVRAWDRYRRAS